MYDLRPNLIIGFHGCDLAVRDKLLNNPDEIMVSRKPYDWLGHGMYFWENNFERALQWAEDKKRRGAIEIPAVIGAVLFLGHCCDLTDLSSISGVARAYERMVEEYKAKGIPIPYNRDLPGDRHKDKLLRDRDCAAIEFMHEQILVDWEEGFRQKGFTNIKTFDSTRGIFTEGGPAFEGSGIMAKTHTQICVRNLNCILGFFLPRREMNSVPALTAGRPRVVRSDWAA